MSTKTSVEAVSTTESCNAILAKPETTLLSPSEKMDEGESSTNNTYTIETILNSKGYKILNKLTTTSQGAIYTALNTNTLTTVIIKIASKHLVDNNIGQISSNTTIKLQENIFNEVNILKQLTIDSNKQNIQNSCVKYIDFFSDSTNYFFIMSHSGESLSNFVEKCHQLIFDNKLHIKQWLIIVQLIFKQIINIIHILHHKFNICHLDISLDNILIKNVQMIKDHNGYFKITNDFQIMLCDFGLAHKFENNSFECDKFVGKRRYMSPEAFNKCIFDARLNDIWSIGVCLFKMCIGWNPYNTPYKYDYQFQLIKTGKIEQLLMMMNKECFVTNDIIDLLKRIFKIEKDRIILNEIQNHSFLRI